MSNELREYADIYQGTSVQTQANYQEPGTLTVFIGDDQCTLDVAAVRQLVADLTQFIETNGWADGSWESLGDDAEDDDEDDDGFWDDEDDDEGYLYDDPQDSSGPLADSETP